MGATVPNSRLPSVPLPHPFGCRCRLDPHRPRPQTSGRSVSCFPIRGPVVEERQAPARERFAAAHVGEHADMVVVELEEPSNNPAVQSRSRRRHRSGQDGVYRLEVARDPCRYLVNPPGQRPEVTFTAGLRYHGFDSVGRRPR